MPQSRTVSATSLLATRFIIIVVLKIFQESQRPWRFFEETRHEAALAINVVICVKVDRLDYNCDARGFRSLA